MVFVQFRSIAQSQMQVVVQGTREPSLRLTPQPLGNPLNLSSSVPAPISNTLSVGDIHVGGRILVEPDKSDLVARIAILEEQVLHLWNAPGMPGYMEAYEHWTSNVNN